MQYLIPPPPPCHATSSATRGSTAVSRSAGPERRAGEKSPLQPPTLPVGSIGYVPSDENAQDHPQEALGRGPGGSRARLAESEHRESTRGPAGTAVGASFVLESVHADWSFSRLGAGSRDRRRHRRRRDRAHPMSRGETLSAVGAAPVRFGALSGQ